MQEPTTPSSSERDADGVRIVERDPSGRRRTFAYQVLALFFVAASAGYLLMPKRVPASSKHAPPPRGEQARASASAAPVDPSPATAQAQPVDPAANAAPAAAPNLSTRSLTPRRTASKKPGAEELDPGDPDQQPEFVGIDRNVTMGEYIQALHDAGIYEGLGAFNPPGTSPPLEGLAVPEGYEVPEGYVEHHQATDDGQPIEPILMFGDPSEFEFYGPNGERVEIPEDRVVPPEMAPPGFPIRRIEIPPPREPGDLSR
jgi:hypothetical protein